MRPREASLPSRSSSAKRPGCSAWAVRSRPQIAAADRVRVLAVGGAHRPLGEEGQARHRRGSRRRATAARAAGRRRRRRRARPAPPWRRAEVGDGDLAGRAGGKLRGSPGEGVEGAGASAQPAAVDRAQRSRLDRDHRRPRLVVGDEAAAAIARDDPRPQRRGTAAVQADALPGKGEHEPGLVLQRGARHGVGDGVEQRRVDAEAVRFDPLGFGKRDLRAAAPRRRARPRPGPGRRGRSSAPRSVEEVVEILGVEALRLLGRPGAERLGSLGGRRRRRARRTR